MDEWLIRTVMALYTEACTVVKTDAGLSESFEVKVRLHQGLLLLFAFQSMFISIWVSRLEIAEFPDSVRRSAP